VAQLTRAIQRIDKKEESTRECDRFEERTLSSATRATYAFNARGWTAARGTASCTFALREGDKVRQLVAEFDYFTGGDDYGDWGEECETGSLRFLELGADGEPGDPMRLREVPPEVFSEACLDVEAAVVSAGGKSAD
jgi:hypothetical protein